MAHNIEVTIFRTPVENVRGTVVAVLTDKRFANKRIAHAYLFTDKPPQIALDRTPRNPTINDVGDYIGALNDFVNEVNRNRN